MNGSGHPSGSAKPYTLDLPFSLKSRLSQGHPWVYRDQVPGSPDLPSGTWVQVRCGGFAAYGLWDRASPIAVRVFSRRGLPDSRWVAARVSEAWEIRASVRETLTNAYRWVYGESDGMPGIVVDLYGEYAAIQTYSDSVESLLPWVADALHAHTRLRGVSWRRPDREWQSLWGRLPPRELTVEENGLLFYADLQTGQKTGLFFDQRDNRGTLAALCQDLAVLDCFCYTGAFSLYAARAGARSIVACDAAHGAIEAAQRNFALNGLDEVQHTFLTGDCFQLLGQFAEAGRRFDLVILDPPSFARDRASRHAAERAYVRLNQLALRCAEPGGLLASSSCTSQVSPEAFRQAMAEAGRRAGRRLTIVHEAGQPADHPVAVHFPEGRYLKFLICRVLPLD